MRLHLSVFLKKFFSTKSCVGYLFDLIIIVFGITISFWLQSRYNTSENLRKQKGAYERILADLELDRTYLELAFANNQSQVIAAQEIIRGAINEDNFNHIIHYYGTFFNDNTINSIRSTGLLENFANKKLINELLTYYRQNYDFLTHAARFDEKIAIENILHVASTIQIDSVSIKDHILHQNKSKTARFGINERTKYDLINNEKFIGLLNSKVWIKSAYNNSIERAIEKNLSLAMAIEEELKFFE